MTNDELQKLIQIFNESKNRILLYLEAVVPPHQFKALRKLVLDELGHSGAEGKIRELLKDRNGQARAESGKGGGVYE